MCVELPLDKKTMENQDWATGPRGRHGPWAAGRWAIGQLGRWAVAAVGRRLLGRGPAFSKTLDFRHTFTVILPSVIEPWITRTSR